MPCQTRPGGSGGRDIGPSASWRRGVPCQTRPEGEEGHQVKRALRERRENGIGSNASWRRRGGNPPVQMRPGRERRGQGHRAKRAMGKRSGSGTVSNVPWGRGGRQGTRSNRPGEKGARHRVKRVLGYIERGGRSIGPNALWGEGRAGHRVKRGGSRATLKRVLEERRDQMRPGEHEQALREKKRSHRDEALKLGIARRIARDGSIDGLLGCVSGLLVQLAELSYVCAQRCC